MPNDEPLAVELSESLKLSDAVKTRIVPAKGLVAVLDALGTKLFSQEEAEEFIAFRDSITTFTDPVFETNLSGLQISQLRTFTLNDTILYAYIAASEVTLADVERFCHVLRYAEMRSIVQKYSLRGAFAVGKFFIGDERTVLGPAVSDAASWYEAADWIGIQATPHASLFAQSLLEKSSNKGIIDHVLLDYEIPIKSESKKLRLKAVNWPKGFYIRGYRPGGSGSTRGLVLSALTKRRVPRETESKYFNAMEFFDFVEHQQDLEGRFSAKPSPPPPGTS